MPRRRPRRDRRSKEETPTSEEEKKPFRIRIRDPRHGFWAELGYSLRRRVLTGVLTIVPLAIAALPVYLLYPKLNLLAEFVSQKYLKAGRLDEETTLILKFGSMALALILVVSALYIVGLLSSTFFVRSFLNLLRRIIEYVPIVNFCHRTTKQVVDLIEQQSSKPFNKVVIIEYPRRGVFALGFVTGEHRYPGRFGELVHVFLPTTPNPTSGFLLLLSPGDVTETGLTVDDAVRFIISGGILDMGEIKPKPFESTLPPPPKPAPHAPIPPAIKIARTLESAK
ncbi:MAG: hypothetical protein BWZ10_01887 [candidate division BRC1 bacterium ADurb.BinA364]|nr:MAG: hypothetical protein BWZ10_01887 [candidate division BRC1 bacterium ADurb.BinA364]